MQILLIGEEPLTLKLLNFLLTEEAYKVWPVTSVSDGLAVARREGIDLVVLDAKAPPTGRGPLFQQLRAFEPLLPIVVIAGGASRDDRIRALRDGADDYIAKPFDPAEVAARVYALARRTSEILAPELQTRLCIGPICLDVRGQALINLTTGTTAHLTRMEVQLMHVLMRTAGHVQTHDQVIADAWGGDYEGSSNQLEVYIHRLRRHLRDLGADPHFIRTLAGGSYEVVLQDPERVMLVQQQGRPQQQIGDAW
ncbi:MAG TPA: response regulator transcription factor [Chloroflexia bacterium]|nr:response regulator transcription factor [Chloroflexia bacterium]